MPFPVLFQQAPAPHFPNGLLETDAKAVAPRWGLLAVLALLCFLPRAWIAWHWDLVWTDSVTYLHAAEAIERGDLHAAFEETGLNIYPVILCGLRQLGADWTVVGTWWSVLMATATVLPLFGWVRRQFDDQVATVACLAYAFHGKLIAVSVLIIRDPTFWFLFNVALYLLWRAATEIRWRLFFAAGLSIALAVHTRSEGWLLTVPLLFWSAFRLPAVPGRRRRLVCAASVCVAMIPLGMAVVNVTWLRDAPRWGLVRAAHVEIVRNWLGWESTRGEATAVFPPGTAAPAGGSPATMTLDIDPMGFSHAPLPKELCKFGETLVKSYTYLLGLLALVGVWRWWRVYLRRDHQTLLFMVLALLAMIWIRNTQARGDIRYFFPMVLVSFPWIGLGLLKVSEWGARVVSWWREPKPATRAAMTGVLLAAVVVFGVSKSNTNLASARFMRQHAELGRWIHSGCGANRTIVGNIIETRLVQHYSRGNVVGYVDPRSCERSDVPAVVRAVHPDIVLLWSDPPSRVLWMRCRATILADRELGYAAKQLPASCGDVAVLVRVR